MKNCAEIASTEFFIAFLHFSGQLIALKKTQDGKNELDEVN